MVNEFCRYKFLWDLYLQSIARIDVLMSLATVSISMGPYRCIPQFREDSLFIKNGCHAGLLQVK